MGGLPAKSRRWGIHPLQVMNTVSGGLPGDRSGADRTQLSEFDLYAQNLRRMDILVMLVGREQAGWRIDRCSLDRLTLQFEGEGAANVRIGVMPETTIGFRMRASAGSEPARANGQAIVQDSIVVLPPGRPFILSSSGASDWISIFLNVDGSRGSDTRLFGATTGQLGADVAIIATGPGVSARIMELASTIREAAAAASHAPPSAEMQQSLIDALGVATELRIDERPRSPSRSWAGAERIVLRALAFIHAHRKARPTVESLREAIGATNPSLRRAFQAYFDMGPANFLKVYRLNQVRRTILTEAPRSLTVTALLASHSVTEFGRFAGEYKALFGERPSETLRKQVRRSDYRTVGPIPHQRDVQR